MAELQREVTEKLSESFQKQKAKARGFVPVALWNAGRMSAIRKVATVGKDGTYLWPPDLYAGGQMGTTLCLSGGMTGMSRAPRPPTEAIFIQGETREQ